MVQIEFTQDEHRCREIALSTDVGYVKEAFLWVEPNPNRNNKNFKFDISRSPNFVPLWFPEHPVLGSDLPTHEVKRSHNLA